MRAVERIGWGGEGNGVWCLFIRGIQPRGRKTITVCRVFESKNFGVCNAFSTPGLNAFIEEFFILFTFLVYCFLMWFILLLSAPTFIRIITIIP